MKNLSHYLTVRNVVAYAAFVCLVLALTLAYVMRADKVYSSNALVLVRADLYNTDGGKTSSDARAEAMARSQIPLFESEDVLRSAITQTGVQKLYKESELRGPLKPEDQAYVLARRSLDVQLEPQTDLIRVSFKHGDPTIAAEFVRLMIGKFSQRYYEIYQNAGTVTFFQEQREQAAGDFAQASGNLAKYAADNQVYRIEEQQRLLLAQRSKVAGSLSSTQAAINQKRAEKESIPRQLAQMKVVGRLPQVTALTQQRQPQAQGGSPTAADVATGDRIDRLASDPPILLVKVYQDTIAYLVKLHTDLDGLVALEQSQAEQLKGLDTNLNALADQAAEFEKLKLAADAANQRVKAYTKRALDEQLTHAMNTNNLSSIQIVQSPTIPFKPIWPVPVLLFAAALGLCLLPISGLVAYEVVKAAAAMEPQPAVTRSLATVSGPTKPMPVANSDLSGPTKPMPVVSDKDGVVRPGRKVIG